MFPNSVVYGTLYRLGHLLPVYAVVFGLLVIIFHHVAELVSASMNANETRYYMQVIWRYGPAIVAGLLLMELFYWAVAYDIFCALHMETQWAAKVAGYSAPSIDQLTARSFWDMFRANHATSGLNYIHTLNMVWNVLVMHGANPMITLLVGFASGLYVVLNFVVGVITAVVYYAVCEIDAIVCAGLSSAVSVVALVTVPLMTPIAWALLLAITFLELFIGFLQAYVFVTLSSLYLNDVIKLH